MIKKVFGIALLAVSLIAAPSMAQSTSGTQDNQVKKERVDSKKDKKGKKDRKDKKECKQGKKECKQGKQQCTGDKSTCKVAQGDKQKMRGDRGNRQMKKANPYEGLVLTESQLADLQVLDQNQREQMKANREQMKANEEQLKVNRDSARVANKRAYLQEVKKIVGPEQYVIFLENQYVTAAPQQKMGGKPKMQRQQRPERKPAQQIQAEQQSK